MKKLNRYQLDISNVDYKYPLEMTEDPDGDYVLYVDVTDEIDHLRAENEALRAKVPEGCTPADARVLRKANLTMAIENAELRAHVEAVAKYAYAQGYGHGHDDAAEGAFGDADEIAADWFTDAVADGAIDALREGE